MDAAVYLIAFLVLIVIVAFTPLNHTLLRFLYKNERITPSSSTAQNNVRLLNEYNGVKYVPIAVEPVNENEFNIRVESTEAPYRETIITIMRDQLKHDPIEVLKSGLTTYRIMPREFVNKNFGIDDEMTPDPTFTKPELEIMSAEKFKELKALEGEVSTLKANKEEEVDNSISRYVKTHPAQIIGK